MGSTVCERFDGVCVACGIMLGSRLVAPPPQLQVSQHSSIPTQTPPRDQALEAGQYTAVMRGGVWEAEVGVGNYSCLVRHSRYYSAFFEDCLVGVGGLDLGTVSLLPFSQPHET